jgi:hypothetical protein
MHRICAIVKCDQPVSESANATVRSKTCANSEHKKIEAKNKERGASNFILKERFRQTQLSHPVNPMEVDNEIQHAEDVEDEVEWYEVNQSGKVSVHSKLNPGTVGAEDDAMEPVVPCPSKPATGNRTIKAQFGRRRTHNEQTLVRPCGIIYARATMYGTEAVSNFLVCPYYAHRIDASFSIYSISLTHVGHGSECILCTRSQET